MEHSNIPAFPEKGCLRHHAQRRLREHDNRFRTYDPGTGRYISADPIGQFGLLEESEGGLAGVLPVVLPGSLDVQHLLTMKGVVEPAGWDANVFAYALNNPIGFSDSTGLSTDRYVPDNSGKHGGPHVDRYNKAGQNVGRYRPDGSPMTHKGKPSPPVPKSDKKRFKKALDKLKLPGAVAPGVSSLDAFCIRNPDQCAAMFPDDLPPVDAGPPGPCE